MMGLPTDNSGKTPVEKISTPIQKRVTPDDVYLEAKMAGVDPKVYAEKLNANLDRQEKMESELDFSVQETTTVLEEARKAGIDISDPEERNRVLKIAREQKTQKALTEDEKAKIVAERTGSTVEFVKEIWAIERKKKEEEKKRGDKIAFSVREQMAAGFGSEIRPSIRKRSQKIIEQGE